MRHLAARVASRQTSALGEGPAWDESRRQLVWVDINAGEVHRGALSGGRVEVLSSVRVDDTVGAAVPAVGGDLLVAGRHALHRLRADGTTVATWPVLPTSRATRLNDGGCDPAGRFLVGSLSEPRRPGQEVLVRLEHSGALTVLDDDLSLSNGLAWSPDGTTMYSIDTVPGIVWRRDYDPVSGAVGARSELLTVSEGSPDGLAVDVEGNLWIAVWGAGQVRCYRPDGPDCEVVAVVDVPAPHTSCPAFVGPDRDLLLITTARDELSPAQLEEFPDSGRLFLAEPGVAGVPVAPWEPVPPPHADLRSS